MKGGAERRLSQTTACRSRACNGLIHRFDDVPSYCLGCLLTLGRKVVPCLRLVKCLRLIQALPGAWGSGVIRARIAESQSLDVPQLWIALIVFASSSRAENVRKPARSCSNASPKRGMVA